jgi:hypothetical protein
LVQQVQQALPVLLERQGQQELPVPLERQGLVEQLQVQCFQRSRRCSWSGCSWCNR